MQRRSRMRRNSNAILSDRSSIREEEFIPNRSSVTISFSYALSVEKALRRKYRVQVFGPLSAGPPTSREPLFDIEHLPDIYQDLVYMNRIVEHNREYAERNRDEGSLLQDTSLAEDPAKLKLPKIRGQKRSRENSISQTSRLKSPSNTKLPLIGRTSSLVAE